MNIQANKMTDDEKHKLLFDYWHDLRQHMREKGSHVEPLPPAAWTCKKSANIHEMQRFWIEDGGCEIAAAIRGNLQKAVLVVRFSLHGPVKKQKVRYDLLDRQKAKIKEYIGPEFKWPKFKAKKPLNAENLVQVVRLSWKNCDVSNRDNWGEFHQWHCKYLEKFHDAFHERIKNLNG